MVDLAGVNYISEGEGQCVVLLNGQFMSVNTWEYVIEDLNRFYRIVALEFPNQGKSASNKDFVSIQDYCLFFLDFLKTIGLKPEDIIVFGFSFGANIVKALALKFKVTFKAIIIGGTGPLRLKRSVNSEYGCFYSLIESGNLEEFGRLYYLSVFSDDFIKKNKQIMDYAIMKLSENYKNRPEALYALIKASESINMELSGLNEKYECDIYLIAAKYDSLVDYETAVMYAKEINSILYTINSGHAMIIENAFECISVLHDILQKYE